jgi:ADP-ribosylglycohydrolase
MTSLQMRYQGCLLGLAVGDALGTTLEFMPPGSFTPITDMTGGGPFRLKPGQWTDDTSMALCLAPVPLFFAGDPRKTIEKSGESSRTTHGASAAIDACRYFAALIVGAINGQDKETLLSDHYTPVSGYWQEHPLVPEIAEIAA